MVVPVGPPRFSVLFESEAPVIHQENVRKGIPGKAVTPVGAHQREKEKKSDPTSLPSGSWNATPTARYKQRKRQSKNPPGQGKRPNDPRRNSTGSCQDTREQHVSPLRMPVLGSVPFACCSVLGLAPEGSTTETLRLLSLRKGYSTSEQEVRGRTSLKVRRGPEEKSSIPKGAHARLHPRQCRDVPQTFAAKEDEEVSQFFGCQGCASHVQKVRSSCPQSLAKNKSLSSCKTNSEWSVPDTA